MQSSNSNFIVSLFISFDSNYKIINECEFMHNKTIRVIANIEEFCASYLL